MLKLQKREEAGPVKSLAWIKRHTSRLLPFQEASCAPQKMTARSNSVRTSESSCRARWLSGKSAGNHSCNDGHVLIEVKGSGPASQL